MRKLFLLVLLSQLGATDCGGVLRDSGFDLWCGEELCAWKVTRGEIQMVPTWNEGDKGVELVGSDVAIQQLSPVTSNDGVCIRFHLIANVEPTADVFLNIDVQGDGTVDRSERIPTADWKPLEYSIAFVRPYSGVRFEITKTGRGTAVLANIGAEISDDCGGIDPIDPGPRRTGAMCHVGTDCESGLCGPSPTPLPDGGFVPFACLACDPEADACGTGQVCGVGEPFSPIYAAPVECVAAAQKPLGEQCIEDAECATNLCVNNVCSTCFQDCSGTRLCEPAWDAPSAPMMCAPNSGMAAAGAPCANHADCASGTCLGTERSQCDDGRACSSPAECPFTGLQNGPCTTVGIEGGVCQ